MLDAENTSCTEVFTASDDVGTVLCFILHLFWRNEYYDFFLKKTQHYYHKSFDLHSTDDDNHLVFSSFAYLDVDRMPVSFLKGKIKLTN